MSTFAAALADRWREQAGGFRKYGADALAQVLETCAEELEDAAREDAEAVLTLDEAAAESGYTYSHLQSLVARGEIPNAGEHQAPRIRRADLPRKVGYGRAPRSRRDLMEETLQEFN